MNARSEGVDESMARIVPTILLHSRHPWRECRGLSGTIPACFALSRPCLGPHEKSRLSLLVMRCAQSDANFCDVISGRTEPARDQRYCVGYR